MDGSSQSHIEEFSTILQTPIQRGSEHGIVGNGQAIMLAWKIYRRMKQQGSGLTAETWRQLDRIYGCTQSEEAEAEWLYYGCPTCSRSGHDSFL